MGIHTEIEIPVPPADVREVFLDTAHWHEWHSALVRSVKTTNGQPTLHTAQVGDILDCDFGDFKGKTTIEANTPEEFRWIGKAPLEFLGAGSHFWRFEESQVNAGGTRFVHGEDQTGILALVLGQMSPLHGMVKNRFARFNQDLKERVVVMRKTKEGQGEAAIGVSDDKKV